MMGTELIGLSLLILAIVGLHIWGTVKHSKKEKALKNLLANVGFAPCNKEKKALSEKVTLLENNRKTSLPFQIYLKPTSLKEGIATKILRSVTTTGWDSQSDDLVNIVGFVKSQNLLYFVIPAKAGI